MRSRKPIAARSASSTCTSTASSSGVGYRRASNRFAAKSTYTSSQKLRFLERLTAAETLERYLHTRYVGQKRFSLEGGESLIVALDELVRVAGAGRRRHRGRHGAPRPLNVLVNTLGKAPSMLFDEFEGKKPQDLTSGDVKYHMGYSSDVIDAGRPVPSDAGLQPVAPGNRQSRWSPVRSTRASTGAVRGREKVLPVLIHGDAAVAGQGVNQEMLNFSQTRGYGTGGTVHIVVNNQIGFTTSDPRDYRSSLYCTDIFKMVDAPIFHVNGDDPEAVALATRAGHGIPPGVQEGRGDRHRLLPQARPQRAGRADGHAAADVQEDRSASGHPQALRRPLVAEGVLP
jgi:2-oxoglutarate dehydrogenase E1 component